MNTPDKPTKATAVGKKFNLSRGHTKHRKG